MISETLFPNSPERIWVLDTSALVQFKKIVNINDQWEAFKQLEEMVLSGALKMPNQVISEASRITRPDVPGVWASGMRGKRVPPLEPDEPFLESVMKEVGNVVDPTKTQEDADPYVIALALQLNDNNYKVSVISNEVVDHSPRISIQTACDRLSIHHQLPQEFLSDVNIDVKDVESEIRTIESKQK